MIIAHVLNPVVVNKKSDLNKAQPITFESIRLAKIHVKKSVEVELYSVHHPEDGALVPEWIKSTRNLDRSVLDVGNFQRPRKLPLIKDILDRLYEEASYADYFIYTNVDIGLVPYFYDAVSQIIDSGHDAIIINRRTISKSFSDPSQLPLMWAQVGEKHPGFDCFIFKREAYAKYDFGKACIGANWIGRVLLVNICAYAENFKIFDNLHLTFHLGDDRSWKDPKFRDYDDHNLQELLKILEELKSLGRFKGRSILSKINNEMLKIQKTQKIRSTQKPQWWPFRGQ